MKKLALILFFTFLIWFPSQTTFADADSDIIPIELNHLYHQSIEKHDIHKGVSKTFKVTVPDSGIITVYLKNHFTPDGIYTKTVYGKLTDSDGNYILDIRNTGKILQTDKDFGDKAYSYSRFAIEPGTYYLEINDSISLYDFPHTFQFKVGFKAYEYVEHEVPDSSSYHGDNTNKIELNHMYHGTSTPFPQTLTYDRYKFTINREQRIWLRAKQVKGSEWAIVLLNKKGDHLLKMMTNSKTDNDVVEKSIVLPKGTYTATITPIDNAYDEIYALMVATQTPSINKEQVKIDNNHDANDTISINNLQDGDIIHIYQNGKEIAKTQSKGNNAQITIPQLGSASGTVQLVNKRGEMKESEKVAIPYEKEIIPALNKKPDSSNNHSKDENNINNKDNHKPDDHIDANRDTNSNEDNKVDDKVNNHVANKDTNNTTNKTGKNQKEDSHHVTANIDKDDTISKGKVSHANVNKDKNNTTSKTDNINTKNDSHTVNNNKTNTVVKADKDNKKNVGHKKVNTNNDHTTGDVSKEQKTVDSTAATNNNGQDNKKPNQSDNKLPVTASSNYNVLAIGLLFILFGGILFIKYKRRVRKHNG